MNVLVGVPVKRFFVAKRRLGPILDAEARSRLGRDLAAHTISTIAAAGGEPLVVAADGEVARWAGASGWSAIVDQGTGLDAAAARAASMAEQQRRPWLIVHADLPLLAEADISVALDALDTGREVIAPSNDGGTSLLGAARRVRFGYGPASFHRHLARLEHPQVVVRLGLALDLDDASDLAAARSHPRGRWLDRYPPPRP
ncbi:MAG TPA: 2-phospho-L-lactate guanylyltransferase [Acidimicrobiia bacterium]|nr:2-phospho-L-lactate guanylyltransferase [Acidimicrobiia bacterium]